MKQRISYVKVYQDPPLQHVQIKCSEIVEDADVQARINLLCSYTPDAPYLPADKLHGLRWFTQALSWEPAP